MGRDIMLKLFKNIGEGITGSITLILKNELYVEPATLFFKKIYVCFWTKISIYFLFLTS